MNHYRVLSPIIAIRWEVNPTGKDTAETVHLSQGSIVAAHGSSKLGAAFVDVSYEGRCYTVFRSDLKEHTAPEPVISSLVESA